MYIYFCQNCRRFEPFEKEREIHNCSQCGGKYLPLGVTVDEWNNYSNEKMLSAIKNADPIIEIKRPNFEQSQREGKYCPECNTMVSLKAQTCPNCGYPFEQVYVYPVENKSRWKTFLIIAIISFLISIICWFYEASHGVAIAEAEIDYIAANYVSDILVMARICAIFKPVSLISGIVFSILTLVKYKK